MEICRICGKVKGCADTCADYQIIIKGVAYPPVRYRAKKYNPFSPEDSEMRCPACNVKPGAYHHVGCTIERCPACGGCWISCRCPGIKEIRNEAVEVRDNLIDLKAEISRRKKDKK